MTVKVEIRGKVINIEEPLAEDYQKYMDLFVDFSKVGLKQSKNIDALKNYSNYQFELAIKLTGMTAKEVGKLKVSELNRIVEEIEKMMMPKGKEAEELKN